MLDRRLVYGLVALAIAARIAAVLVLQSHRVPRSTYEHGEIAKNLLEGRGFSVRFLGADGPTSQQAPVYPVLVAAAYAVGGVETPRALLILEVGQALLSGLMVAGVLMLVREVAPNRPWLAFLAGLIAALHPTLVYAATHVQVAPLAAALLVTALAWAYRAGRTGRTQDFVVSGILLATVILTDPILGLAAPAMVWAGCVRGGRFALALRRLVVMGSVAVAGVTPWIVRNALVHHEFVFIKSTFGYAFWQGNCTLSEGTDKVVRASVERVLETKGEGLRRLNAALWAARHEAGYLDDIALTQADYRELGAVSEPERSRRLLRRALHELRAEPARYATLCARRLSYFLLFDETNPKTRNIVYRVSHVGLTVLAILGWLVMPSKLRWSLAPTALTFALIGLFHTLTIVSARFHVPLEPLMAIWAAGGLAPVAERLPAWVRNAIARDRERAPGRVLVPDSGG
jgi:hypothetical protein